MTELASGQRLAVDLAGIRLRNPLFLASGTAGYGRELDGVLDLDLLGGIVTKAVSPEPRQGAAAPRVAEFRSGMLNAVGLANPGVEAVAKEHLPWLHQRRQGTRVLVNVVGSTVGDFPQVIGRLDGCQGFDGFELNVSCPNTRAGGMEFGADPATLRAVVSASREVTDRPLFVKLSPTVSDIARAACVALEAGATGLSLVNTLPGLLVDIEKRKPVLGFGSGGMSGAALLPVGVLATWKVYRATRAPIMGLGGITTHEDAIQYLMAGAAAFALGTAVLRDPRLPGRLLRDLASWCEVRGVRSVAELTGVLEWPA